jgi:hypothetical protein
MQPIESFFSLNNNDSFKMNRPEHLACGKSHCAAMLDFIRAISTLIEVPDLQIAHTGNDSTVGTNA